MKVVFLDRDGTVIAEPGDRRVDSVDKIQLFDDTIEALQYFADNGFAAIFITNQAGIEEGRLTEEEFWNIHRIVLEKIAASGITILHTYFNKEAQRADNTDWRKPGPKMLLQAAHDFDLDISDTYMIGDSSSDIEASVRAGCKGGVLLRTTDSDALSTDAVFSANTLYEAARYVVGAS